MRIVLDPNARVSGIFFGGPPGRILEAWAGDQIELVASPPVLEEYRRVSDELGAKHVEVDISRILDVLTAKCEICIAPPLPEPVCRDPGDDKFLACALSSQVRVIVSGDKDLIECSGFNGIEVVTPRRFVEVYLGTG